MCVSRKFGECQSKDAKTDGLKSGWDSKLHLLWFASPTVPPRNPRQACLPLSVYGLSSRSGRCQLEHLCRDCCLYHLSHGALDCNDFHFLNHFPRFSSMLDLARYLLPVAKHILSHEGQEERTPFHQQGFGGCLLVVVPQDESSKTILYFLIRENLLSHHNFMQALGPGDLLFCVPWKIPLSFCH